MPKTMLNSLEEVIRKTEKIPEDAYFNSSSEVYLFIVNLNKFPDDEGVVKYALGAQCLQDLSDETVLSVRPGEDQLIAVTEMAYYQRTGNKWTPRFRPACTLAPSIPHLDASDIFAMSRQGETSNAATPN